MLLLLFSLTAFAQNEVPIEITKKRINVPCADGDHYQTCIFDSGTPETFMPLDADLQKERKDLARAVKYANEHSKPPAGYGILEFKMGSKTVQKNYPVFIDDQILSPIIGMSVFKNTAGFQLDAATSRLEIFDQAPGGKYPLTLTEVGLIEIGFKIGNNLDGIAIWHTGSGSSLVNPEFVKANPTHFTKIGSRPVENTIDPSKPYNLDIYEIDQFTVGNVAFEKLKVINAWPLQNNRDIHMILGLDIISKMKWTFDYDKKLWDVSAIATQTDNIRAK